MHYDSSKGVINNTLFVNKPNNRVGINTGIPLYDLDVYGLINASSNLSVGGNVTVTGAMIACNVGMNCNSPAYALDVSGTIHAKTLKVNAGVGDPINLFSIPVNINASEPVIQFRGGNEPSYIWSDYSNTRAGEGIKIGFHGFTSNGTAVVDSVIVPGTLYCLMEVGSLTDPWKYKYNSQYWETGAPPLGSGVYWIWGTPDGYISRPINESFSFNTVYNNPSTAITATLIGALDNFGYVKINGRKYPPQDTWDPVNKLYYGFVGGIPSTQVTLDAGTNRIEIFCQNASLSSSPAACWLTISANGQILVKTDCTSWTVVSHNGPGGAMMHIGLGPAGSTAGEISFAVAHTESLVSSAMADRPAMSIISGPNATYVAIEGPSDIYNTTYHGGIDIITNFNGIRAASHIWTGLINNSAYICARANGPAGGVMLQANTSAWTAFSDERNKEHIEHILNAAEFLTNVRTIKYALKECCLDSANSVGFMAQDFVNDYPEIVPRFVNEDGTEKLGLRYTEIIPIVVAAIKEQQIVIESQAAQLSALQTSYDTLVSALMG